MPETATCWSSRPTSPSEAGYFGDLLATALAARGVRGLVIDAGCRDVAELTAMGFPVWSRCVSAFGTRQGDARHRQRAACLRRPAVEPGDVVVADDDGVVVVPRDEAATVLAAAQAREEKEAGSPASATSSGELSLDMNDMRGELDATGLRYVDYQDARPVDHRLPRPLHHRARRSTRRSATPSSPALDDPTLPAPTLAKISDDELRESVEPNQLRILRERGGDLMLFSPKASGMEHHVARPADRGRLGRGRATTWSHRVAELFPEHFAAVCQLPQTPGGELDRVDRRAAPLRRRARLRRLQPQPRPVRRATGPRRR